MPKTVAVYGATAFSAGPTIEYLLDHPESAGFELVLAGRNGQKLDKVKSGLSRKVETVVLRLDDEGGVKAFTERADVIINFAGGYTIPRLEKADRRAGPYSKHNAEALVRYA